MLFSQILMVELKFPFIYKLCVCLAAEDQISKAELWLTDIADSLHEDWMRLAQELGVAERDVRRIQGEYADVSEQALVMLHLWVQKFAEKATGNELERAMTRIQREDIVKKCMYNIEEVTDAVEKAAARVSLDSSEYLDAVALTEIMFVN